MSKYRTYQIAAPAIFLIFGFFLTMDVLLSAAPGVDFHSFFLAAKAAAANGPLYDHSYLESLVEIQNQHGRIFPYLYPPFLAYALIPLSGLSSDSAQNIWYFLNLLAYSFGIFFSILIFKNLFAKNEDAKFLIGGVIAGLLMFLLLPFRNNMLLGQVNSIVLFFMVLAVYLCTKGKCFTGGFLLSIAIMIKVTPVFLLIFYLARKKYKMLFGTFAGLILIFFIMIAGGGYQHWAEFFAFLPNLAHGVNIPGMNPADIIANFSVAGYLSRIFGAGENLVRIISLLVFAGIYIWLYFDAKKYDFVNSHLLLIMFLIAMVTTSPLAYLHHEIYLAPGALIILLHAAQHISDKKIKIFGSVFIVLLILLSIDYPVYYERVTNNEIITDYVFSFNLFAMIALFFLSKYYGEKYSEKN